MIPFRCSGRVGSFGFTDTTHYVGFWIPCKDCTMAYVGLSGRSLTCRIKEHRRAVQNGDQNSWQNMHGSNNTMSTGQQLKC